MGDVGGIDDRRHEVEVCELGPLGIRRGDTWASATGERTSVLVAALSLAGPPGVTSEQLIEAMWPSPDQPVTARQSLANIVSRLRRVHGKDFIESTRVGYRFGARVESDRHRFEQEVNRAVGTLEHDSQQALALVDDALRRWRGEPWIGLDRPDSIAGDRAHLHRLRTVALRLRARALVALDRPAEAEPLLEEVLDGNPLDEDAALLLATTLGNRGRRTEALRAIQTARTALADSGLALGAELARLEIRLLGPDESDASVPRVAFPTPDGPIIGRYEYVARVTALVADRPIVTLVGPGGVGKTRLALEVALGQEDRSAVFVDLSPLRNGTLCADALVAALGGAPERLRPPVESVIEALTHQPRLVVLDNCEHLVAAVAELTSHVAPRCPSSRFLATSREPLSIGGEHVVPVDPLSTEADGPCVDLFLRRAAESGAQVGIGTARSDVARLCAALDGLPLAVELAASRSAILAPREMLDSLDQRFALLRAPGGTGRHATLFDTIEWSWEQLDADERNALAQLAAFASPATLASLSRVLDLPFTAVVDTFEKLVRKSLVVVTRVEPDTTRVHLLDSVRHFALDRAREGGSIDRLADSHLRWVEEETRDAVGEHGLDARHPSDLRRLDIIGHEIRLALDRAAAGGDAVTGLRVCARVFNWWRGRGAAAEGFARLKELDTVDASTPLRIEAAACSAPLAQLAGRPTSEVVAATAQARRLMTSTPEFAGRNRVELRLLEAEFDDADPDLADRLTALIDTFDREGSTEASIAWHLLTAWTITNDAPSAPARADETLRASEQANVATLAHARELQGLAQLAIDRPGDARRHLVESLELFEEIGQRFCTVHCCESIAWWSAAMGRVDEAVALLGAVEGVRFTANRARAGFEQPAVRGTIALIGATPSPDAEATLETITHRAREILAAESQQPSAQRDDASEAKKLPSVGVAAGGSERTR